MDPLRTDESNNNVDSTQTLQAIMQQLTGISNTLQAQERRLGHLETTRGPPTTAFREPETSQTGGEARGTPPQERSAQGATNRGMEGFIQRLLRDNDREETPVYQHGIRAENLWKTDYELSKDAFKSTPKLESAKDYTVWRFAILKFLDKEGLSPFALGTAVEPRIPRFGRDEDAEEIRLFQRWHEFNSACETAILSCIGKTQMGLLTRCKNAKEMWSRLEKHYLHDSEVNVARLEDELHNLKWSRNTTLENYIESIDKIADQLRGCGHEVPDSRLRICLLRGLPDRLDSVKHILLQMGSMSYTSLCDHLRSHVGLANFGEGSSRNSSKAYLGTSESNDVGQPKKTQEKGKKKCGYCKKNGHSESDCRKKAADNKDDKSKNKDGKQGKDITCYKCQKKGHMAKDCPDRDDQKDESKATTMLAILKRPALYRTGAYMAKVEDITEHWIVDSGATQHMCNKLESFDDSTTRQCGKRVHLGDSKTLPVSLIGNISLDMILPKGETHRVNLQEVLGVPGLAKNLRAVSACAVNGVDIHFESSEGICRILKNKRTIGLAYLHEDGLWILDCKYPGQQGTTWANLVKQGSPLKRTSPPEKASSGLVKAQEKGVQTTPQAAPAKKVQALTAKAQEQLQTWHKRYGHLHYSGLKLLASRNTVDFGQKLPQHEDPLKCPDCSKGKIHRLPFPTAARGGQTAHWSWCTRT